ncbi:MAG: hypothetical protein WA432_04650 [Candidatus Babeliaceae bacterium]
MYKKLWLLPCLTISMLAAQTEQPSVSDVETQQTKCCCGGCADIPSPEKKEFDCNSYLHKLLKGQELSVPEKQKFWKAKLKQLNKKRRQYKLRESSQILINPDKKLTNVRKKRNCLKKALVLADITTKNQQQEVPLQQS